MENRPPRIVMVVACGQNRVIGRDGGMPWHISEDSQHFKRTTMGHPMVMGRKTWESFGGKPLPGRPHVVVTRDASYQAPGAVAVVRSLEEGLAAAREADPATDAIMVVGGGEIYAQAMPIADELVVSWVHQSPEGDTFFPEIDPHRWEETSREPREGFDIVRYAARR